MRLGEHRTAREQGVSDAEREARRGEDQQDAEMAVVGGIRGLTLVSVALERHPRLPGNAQDHDRDAESDDGVGPRESEGHNRRRGDDGQRDVCIGARVVAIGDEGGAVESVSCTRADYRRREVPEVSDDPCRRKRPQVGRGTRVDQTLDGLKPGNARADEDGRDDEQPRATLGAL